jgi:hypothetical protein
LVDSIISTSATPYSALHDIDANKPGGSIKIRVKTYAHSLKLHEERLDDVARRRAELQGRLEAKRLELLELKQRQLAARKQEDAQIDAEIVALRRKIAEAAAREANQKPVVDRDPSLVRIGVKKADESIARL